MMNDIVNVAHAEKSHIGESFKHDITEADDVWSTDSKSSKCTHNVIHATSQKAEIIGITKYLWTKQSDQNKKTSIGMIMNR